MSDDIIGVTPASRLLDGGDGFDILDFGGFQARTVSIYNRMSESGGTVQLVDPASGQVWSLDFVGFEGFRGSPHADRIFGNARTTYIEGGDGDDTVSAQVMDTSLPMTIFGGQGADSVAGSEVGDLLHGNQGDDVVHGWEGPDWVYGGQDRDLLFGDDGDDFANGNIGNDTVEGGAGADTVRGGQDNDSVSGGAGDDYVTGDRGADTLSGGAGADIFELNAGSGRDYVVDYNGAEGDRIRVLEEYATNYRVYQDGADAVINFGGSELVIVGVQLSTVKVYGLAVMEFD